MWITNMHVQIVSNVCVFMCVTWIYLNTYCTSGMFDVWVVCTCMWHTDIQVHIELYNIRYSVHTASHTACECACVYMCECVHVHIACVCASMHVVSVCMWVCTFVHVSVCMWVYACVSVCMCECVNVCMCERVHLCMCEHVHVWVCTWLHLSTMSSSHPPTTSAKQDLTEGMGSHALWARMGRASFRGLGNPHWMATPRACIPCMGSKDED